MKGADINSEYINQFYYWTHLHRALSNGHFSVLDYFITKGADINAKDIFYLFHEIYPNFIS